MEIGEVLQGRRPGSPDLAHLRYTRMVFEESMRVYPPAWILGRRAVADDEIGGGPRQCIGNHFAMLEAQLILAMVVQTCSLALVPGQTIQPQPLFILRPDRDIWMAIELS